MYEEKKKKKSMQHMMQFAWRNDVNLEHSAFPWRLLCDYTEIGISQDLDPGDEADFIPF